MSSDSDLDDQLRAAMKVLDAEVPSGYWDALPNQTLARLEGSSMQQGTSGTTENKVTAAAPPPMAADNTEDSGLHDIRNLAQSTKQRLSSKRITTSPPVEEDVASSSASWKAVALPQPAKMVALPELADLPSKKEIKAAEKAAAKERRAAEAASDLATATAADTAASAHSAFQLPSAQRSSARSKKPLIAIAGLGLAAAAAVTIYVTTQNKSADKAATVARAESAAAPTPAAVTATPVPRGAAVGGAAAGDVPASAAVQKADDEAAKQQAENDAMKAQLAAAEAAAPAVVDAGDAIKDTHKPGATKSPVRSKGKGSAKLGTGAGAKHDETNQAPPPADKTKVDAKKDAKKDAVNDGEPDFNDLLKEAGVDQKKDQKPKLDKKSLTGDDFKKVMSAVEDKAHGCYKGTQGSAIVKVSIAPSGHITKIAVTGPFAGKPEASCVAAAVRGASFPAWDGAPESFTYPILLSE
jgi:hypothetical protein